MASTPTKERSQSRGRDVFASTGRGGLGNIRQTSLTRPEAAELVRGREPSAALPPASKLYSTGRGGAGNIRSPSRSHKRDPSQQPTLPIVFDASEEDIMKNHLYLTEEAPISTGRGGVGNINSRSRSRGPGLDLNTPNSNPATPHKVSLPKDPNFSKSPVRSAGDRRDGSTTAKDTSTVTATAVEDGAHTYPPSYQTTEHTRED